MSPSEDMRPGERPQPGDVSRLPDPGLVAACLSGDASAWDALTARYAPLICTVAARMDLPPADVEDILQDVCMIALQSLEDLRNVRRLAPWLITVTRREALRLLRRRNEPLLGDIYPTEAAQEAASNVSEAALNTPELEILGLEDRRLVREAHAQLGDRCRALLNLLYRQDPPASYADAARNLNVPLGAIGPTRARCLQRLKKILHEFGF